MVWGKGTVTMQRLTDAKQRTEKTFKAWEKRKKVQKRTGRDKLKIVKQN